MGTKCFDKGAFHIIEAAKLLWDKGIDVTPVLAGPTNRDFASYWNSQPDAVKKRCLVFEIIEGREKKDLFQAMDIFVMPSRNDSFGMVFLESWICEKPVIGAFAGGIPEVISDGEDGYLVPFGNVSMLSEYVYILLNNEKLRTRMGARGRHKALKLHTWDKKYDQLKAHYSRLCRMKT
jgi:glycosyltransferase involved in cell wall biosynthesis